VQKAIDLASERMHSIHSSEKIKSELTPDSYYDLPLAYALLHPIIEDNEVKDLDILFVNNKYCEISGKSYEDHVGHRFTEVFPNAEPQWLQYTYRACYGEVSSGRVFEPSVHHWLQFFCAPASRPGCCSMIFTIVDEDKKNYDNLTKGRTTDDCIIKIARTLNSESDVETAISNSLDYLGKVIHPDRIYIFDIDGWTVQTSSVWCRQGVKSNLNHFRTFDYSYISYWEKILLNDSSVVVHDIGVVAEFNPKFHRYLKKMDIQNFIASPLYEGGKLSGYLVIENFRVDELVDIRRLLETVSFFIADRKAISRSLNKLRDMSAHDSLTGAGSRHALFEKIAELEKVSGMVGVVFADLNGLKSINDNYGHAAGDEAICEAANMLFRFCGKENVYRNGGDEFIALMPDISLGTFEKAQDNITEALGDSSDAKIAAGFEWCEDTRKILASMKVADQNMYAAKASYYKKHDRRSGEKPE